MRSEALNSAKRSVETINLWAEEKGKIIQNLSYLDSIQSMNGSLLKNTLLRALISLQPQMNSAVLLKRYSITMNAGMVMAIRRVLKNRRSPYIKNYLNSRCLDVMTSERPYSKPIPQVEAIQELKDCAGTQFDPDLAKIFVEVMD